MAEKKERPLTYIITPKLRCIFVNVIAPLRKSKIEPDAKPVPGLQILIPKSDEALIKKIKTCMAEARKGMNDKWGTKKIKGLKNPLRDGDEEFGDSEQAELYKGMMFMNVSNRYEMPTVVNRKNVVITDLNDFNSGDYAQLGMNAYGYDNKGKGITFGLNNVRVVEEGDRVGGGSPKAEDDFGDPLDGGVDEEDDEFGSEDEGDEEDPFD